MNIYVVSVELHSGRNRIVRRMFEHLGYEVERLDRMEYGGLNKKNLSRGDWRFLAKHEVEKLWKLRGKQEISSAKLRCKAMKHYSIVLFLVLASHHNRRTAQDEVLLTGKVVSYEAASEMLVLYGVSIR